MVTLDTDSPNSPEVSLEYGFARIFPARNPANFTTLGKTSVIRWISGIVKPNLIGTSITFSVYFNTFTVRDNQVGSLTLCRIGANNSLATEKLVNTIVVAREDAQAIICTVAFPTAWIAPTSGLLGSETLFEFTSTSTCI